MKAEKKIVKESSECSKVGRRRRTEFTRGLLSLTQLRP